MISERKNVLYQAAFLTHEFRIYDALKFIVQYIEPRLSAYVTFFEDRRGRTK